jgi:hypothetical protein
VGAVDACRAVRVQHQYGMLGRGTNIIIRRGWVLLCLLLFAAWIAVDIGAYVAAKTARPNSKDPEELSNGKWPVDTMLKTMSEPYDITIKSVKDDKRDGQKAALPGEKGKEKEKKLCTCTFSSSISRQLTRIPGPLRSV